MTTTTTAPSPSPRYAALSRWEQNGYNDSDFYFRCWDRQKKTVVDIEYMSTRFPGGTSAEALGIDPEGLTWVDVEESRAWLEGKLFEALLESANRRRNSPDELPNGTRVVLTEPHRNMVKEQLTIPCDRCGGTGNWVNPRNRSDIRACFACKGKGTVVRAGARIKTVTGKQEYVTFAAGLCGKVVWSGTYRTIYRNGYNKANNGTLVATVELDSGETVRNIPFSKLRLDIPEPNQEELRAQAHDHSFGLNFGKFSHSRFAWNDSGGDYADQFLSRAGDTAPPAWQKYIARRRAMLAARF
jgi:hypothetical protein